jgi:natural product precursor
MKKLKKIKLDQFSKSRLENMEMNTIRGGADCTVTCRCSCDNYYMMTPLRDLTAYHDGTVNSWIHY